MSDKITKITAENKELLKNKSAYGIPDNPSNHGFSAKQIKSKLADPSLILCDWLSRLANETSSGFDAYDEQIDETVREAAEVYFGSKADKVGPIPRFQVALSAPVKQFVNDNDLDGRTFILDFVAGVDSTRSKTFIGCFHMISSSLASYRFMAVDAPPSYFGNDEMPMIEYFSPAQSIDSNTKFSHLFSDSRKYKAELQSNKKTSLSSSSTDVQYPSAKCVWDITQNLREVAEGKCKSFVLSNRYTKIDDGKIYYLDSSNVEQSVSASYIGRFYIYNSTTEEWEDKRAELENGDYDDITLINQYFASNDALVEQHGYLLLGGSITGGVSLYLTSIGYVQNPVSNYFDKMKTGDVFLVIETDVPDRWISNLSGTYNGKFYKLETAKVPLEDYAAKAGTNNFSGSNYFTGSYMPTGFINPTSPLSTVNGLAISKFGICINGKNDNTTVLVTYALPSYSATTSTEITLASLETDQTFTGKKKFSEIWLTDNSNSIVFRRMASGVEQSLLAFNTTNGLYTYLNNDLGTSSFKWKDLYLTNAIYLGSTQFYITSGGNLRIDPEAGKYLMSTSTFLPVNNLQQDLGANSYKWRDLYVNRYLVGATYSTTIDSLYKLTLNLNTTDNAKTELNYEVVNSISLSANRTFTLMSSPTNTLPEYKALITNSGSSSITLTFTNVTNILCNDDDCAITNAADSTLTLPAGVTIECSIMNGKMVAVNFAA